MGLGRVRADGEVMSCGIRRIVNGCAAHKLTMGECSWLSMCTVIQFSLMRLFTGGAEDGVSVQPSLESFKLFR